MRTIDNDRHALHQGRFEMFRGELVACFEVPASFPARMGLFVFEGGYAVAEVGINTVNVLDGFRQRAG